MVQKSDITNFFNALLPWRWNKREGIVTDKAQRWSRLITAISVFYVFFVLLFALLGRLVNGSIAHNAGLFLQLTGVYSFLAVIDGLTRDEGKSLLAKFCNLRLIQELGKISMTLYLTHEPFIKGLCFAIRRVEGKPIRTPIVMTETTCTLPVWGIPIILLVCPLIAWLLTKFVEEPMKKMIRRSR